MIPWRGVAYGIAFFILAAMIVGVGRLSGAASLVIADHEYSIDLPVLILLLCVFLVALAILVWLLRALIRWPRRYRARLHARQEKAAREELATAYLALGRGDYGAARLALHASDARLGDETLPQILAVQLAIETGAYDDARTRLARLEATNPQIAEQGLFQLARATQDRLAGQDVLTKSLDRNGKNRWALQAALQWAVQDQDWEQARKLAPQLQAAGIWTRDEFRHYRGILTVAALAHKLTDKLAYKEEPSSELSSQLSGDDRRQAERALRDWGGVPAVTTLAYVHAAQGHLKKARQVLAKAWAQEPHGDLATCFLEIHRDVPLEQQQRLAVRFIRGQAEHCESLILRARLALKARHWAHAERLLAPLWEGTSPTARICTLLSEIKAGEGDRGGARAWQDRAVSAPEDESWHADGERLAVWAPVSPRTGQLGAVRWGHPDLGGTAPRLGA